MSRATWHRVLSSILWPAASNAWTCVIAPTVGETSLFVVVNVSISSSAYVRVNEPAEATCCSVSALPWWSYVYARL